MLSDLINAIESDELPEKKKLIKLAKFFNDASEREKDAINEIFIILCGYSLVTLMKGNLYENKCG